MRTIHKVRTRDSRRYRRHLRVRRKAAGSPERPRLGGFPLSQNSYPATVAHLRGVTLVVAAVAAVEADADGAGEAGVGGAAGSVAIRASDSARATGSSRTSFPSTASRRS